MPGAGSRPGLLKAGSKLARHDRVKHRARFEIASRAQPCFLAAFRCCCHVKTLYQNFFVALPNLGG